MTATIIPFPSRAKPKPVRVLDPTDLLRPVNPGWFEIEMRAALGRVFGESDLPSDTEPT